MLRGKGHPDSDKNTDYDEHDPAKIAQPLVIVIIGARHAPAKPHRNAETDAITSDHVHGRSQ